MSQLQLLDIIKQNPGTTQLELGNVTKVERGTISEQIRALDKKKDIYRVKDKLTYRLYINGD